MSGYSTPLWIMSDEEESSGNESSLYLTPPEAFPTCDALQCALYHQPESNSKIVAANVELREISSIVTPSFAKLSPMKRTNSLDIREMETRTPKRNLFDVTPKTYKSSPFKCISNIVTPIEMKPCIIRFDNRLNKDKENQFPVSNSCELGLTDKENSNSQILRSPKYGSCSKNKSSILPWLGIRRKCKTELLPTGRRNTPKSKESYATSYEIDHINIPTTQYGNICQTKVAKESKYSTHEKSSGSSSQDIKSICDSRTSLLSKQEIPIKPKGKRLWHYINLCRKSIRKIHLSPIKRLLSRCRLKISVEPLKALFRRKREKLVDNDESQKLSVVEPCQCTTSTSRQEEYLLQIISRLTSIEEQIKEIKTSMKNTGSNIATDYVLPPPPPPPLPPLQPPLVPNFSSIGVCKRRIDTTTPENEQLVKRPSRPAEMKTQFSITVEDIKSVKLRKTPSFMKSKGAIGSNSPSKSGRDAGIVRSVRFKPSKVRASNRKELSQLVAEILSPSKKNDQSEKENLVNKRNTILNDEIVASNNFETTPVSTANMSSKMRSIKRKDLLIESPTRE